MTKLSYAHALGYHQALEKYALATPSPVDQMMSSVEGAKDVHPGPEGGDPSMGGMPPQTDPNATPPSIKSEELPPELMAALMQSQGGAAPEGAPSPEDAAGEPPAPEGAEAPPEGPESLPPELMAMLAQGGQGGPDGAEPPAPEAPPEAPPAAPEAAGHGLPPELVVALLQALTKQPAPAPAPGM